MAKRAICIGINNYPGTYNDLNGCVNDAHDWADLLGKEFQFGKSVQLMTDSDATRDGILKALGKAVADSKAGDLLVVTFSGHGTWVYDQGERDESDNRDEAICVYDGTVLDDEIRAGIRRLDPGVQLTVISDSCHSGTVTRAYLQRTHDRDANNAENAPKPRYMPPVDDTDALRADLVPVRRRFLYPESDMREILITGCNATEYSYDARIGGRYNGAMTAMAMRVIKSDPSQTYKQFHKNLRGLLPTPRYPQSPQLEGSNQNKNRPLFT